MEVPTGYWPSYCVIKKERSFCKSEAIFLFDEAKWRLDEATDLEQKNY